MKDTTYKNYLLTVLLIILAFNFVDRQILALVLQDIKLDLDLSDSQLGFLSGIAFALFYSIMGIPIARWADRGNRVTIISVTAALWSIMVALCGFAGSFLQLLLIRIGVAVGEAGCIPPAHSLIADYFTRAERPRAVSIYMLGGSLSVVIGYFIGGWLNEFYGWRATFIILGLPGLILAVLVWFTVREPRQVKQNDDEVTSGTPATAPASQLPHPTLKEVFATLWQKATFRHLLFAFAVIHFFGYGIALWLPAFFIRSHGMETGELGTWFALLYGVGGTAGTYMGGYLASRHAAHNEKLQLQVMAIVLAMFSVISVFIYLAPDKYIALMLMGLSAVIGSTISGPLFATIQTLVHERMRATSIALIYFVANLIGMGLGPLAAGILSDALAPAFGQESLRYSLVAFCPGYLWMAVHLWLAGKSVKADLAAVQEESETAPSSKT